MRILVVGAGAVGGYFGAYLVNAGRDVTFLVRPARMEHLKLNGLEVVTPDDRFTVWPQCVLKEELTQSYDLVLLSVKAYGLQAAMADFAPAVGGDTMILPMLNGMSHIDTLVERFGDDAVLGGATRMSTDVDSEGRIIRLTPFRELVYGERKGGVTARMRRVEQAVGNVGIKDVLSSDILAFMWEKWVVLAALAGITCLFRGTIGETASVPRGSDVENAMLDETAAVARAEGHPPSEKFLRESRGRLTDSGSDLTASMFRDMQRQAPVEVEHVIGDLLARGEKHGLSTPLLRAAYVHLAVYQARLAERA